MNDLYKLKYIIRYSNAERVNNEDLKNYVEAYLRKYKEVVEDNLNLVDDIEHVFFKYCWYLIIFGILLIFQT